MTKYDEASTHSYLTPSCWVRINSASAQNDVTIGTPPSAIAESSLSRALTLDSARDETATGADNGGNFRLPNGPTFHVEHVSQTKEQKADVAAAAAD